MQYFHAPINEALTDEFYVSWAGRKQCRESIRSGPKILDTYLLVYVKSGNGSVWQGAGDLEQMGPGSIFVLFPGVKHCYFADEEKPWEIMWVAFNGTLCQQILSAQGIDERHYVLQNSILEQTACRMEALVEALGDEADIHRLEAVGNLLLLLAQMGRAMKPEMPSCAVELKGSEIVPAAVAFIERYYYIHLDVDTLCGHIKYSRSYLSRLFNTECGMAIPEYINQVRIRHAKDLFEHTSLSVQEVSASVGIPDSFYFSKTFKKLTGMAPNQYKKQFSGRRGKVSQKCQG